MNVLVLGSSGFIGRKLVDQLISSGRGGEGLLSAKIDTLTLADAVKPGEDAVAKAEAEAEAASSNSPIPTIRALYEVDIADATTLDDLLSDNPDVIFHLAAVVSGQAEQNFELGYKVNVDGTRALLDAIKSKGETYKPRLVFTSSLAVYGPPIPDIVPDNWATTPRGSYGTQKAIAELLVEDYTRKGYVDGISLRFPTIAIRPGKPNAAASSFISGIIREPLNGLEATLPVNLDFRHTVASPQAAVGYLVHAGFAFKPLEPGDRTLQMPGISLLVEEMIESLERLKGKDVTSLIKHKPDPFIIGIVDNWPKNFEAKRAIELGFVPDASYDDIVINYMKEVGIKYDESKAAEATEAPAKPVTKHPLGLRGFSHISINVPDIDEALKFYHDVLGFDKMVGGKKWGDFDFRAFDAPPFAANAGFKDGHCKVDCTWMYHPQLHLNLELMHFYATDSENRCKNMPKTQDVAGIKHVSFVVENAKTAFDFLKQQKGVKFVNEDPKYEPQQLEPFPFKFFYFIDPFGAMWEVEEYGNNTVTNMVPSVTRQMDAFIEYK